MVGSDRPRYTPGSSPDRRRQARIEDAESEAMIRRYMRLADVALDLRGQEDAGNRVGRHPEMAENWLSARAEWNPAELLAPKKKRARGRARSSFSA